MPKTKNLVSGASITFALKPEQKIAFEEEAEEMKEFA